MAGAAVQSFAFLLRENNAVVVVPSEVREENLFANVSFSIPYYPECRTSTFNCNCTEVAPMCSPVDDISFISPCHAGCKRFFSNTTGRVSSVSQRTCAHNLNDFHGNVHCMLLFVNTERVEI